VPRCLIGIEAGMATHYVARELSSLDHDVRQYRQPMPNRSGKATRTTSETPTRIAEAVQRPSTRCVPVKTDDQLDLQALHRMRSRLVGQRTAVINQIRGFLLEHGTAVRQGFRLAQ
jgi:transposase